MAKPYTWEYNPISNMAIALIGPDGKDHLLATEDGYGNVGLEFAHPDFKNTLLSAINDRAELSTLRETAERLRKALEEAASLLDDAGNYFSGRNLGEPARLLMGRLISGSANSRAALAQTQPGEKK